MTSPRPGASMTETLFTPARANKALPLVRSIVSDIVTTVADEETGVTLIDEVVAVVAPDGGETVAALAAAVVEAFLAEGDDVAVLEHVGGAQDAPRDAGERPVPHRIAGHDHGLEARDLVAARRQIYQDKLARLKPFLAGKRLMLISNSEWSYVQKIMSFAYDPFLAPERTWRDLFELVIVGARTPACSTTTFPAFNVPWVGPPSTKVSIPSMTTALFPWHPPCFRWRLPCAVIFRRSSMRQGFPSGIRYW